jgi:hypothetical protein
MMRFPGRVKEVLELPKNAMTVGILALILAGIALLVAVHRGH